MCSCVCWNGNIIVFLETAKTWRNSVAKAMYKFDAEMFHPPEWTKYLSVKLEHREP